MELRHLRYFVAVADELNFTRAARWTIPEATTTSPTGDRTITNVSDPTVTVYLPAAADATGTAVVVAPGGACGSSEAAGNPPKSTSTTR